MFKVPTFTNIREASGPSGPPGTIRLPIPYGLPPMGCLAASYRLPPIPMGCLIYLNLKRGYFIGHDESTGCSRPRKVQQSMLTFLS